MPAWIHSDPNADDGHWRDDSQRECARGTRCTDPRIGSAGGKMVRLPALTPRAFCDSDRDLVERCVRDLPALELRVHAEIGNRGQASGPRVATSKTPPLPINLNVDELLRSVAAVLVSWHERVADVARLTEPDGSVCTACAVLAPRVEVLLALPSGPMMRSVSLREAAALPSGTSGLVHDGAEYADVVKALSGADAGLEVIQLHYRCRRLLGETPPAARRLDGVVCDCGYTELRELLDDDGAFNGAKCYECGNEYSCDTYKDLVKEREQAVKAAGVHRRRSVAVGVSDDQVTRRA